jgi:ABC-type branched-subunit amino acid transport system substrate-binding protein
MRNVTLLLVCIATGFAMGSQAAEVGGIKIGISQPISGSNGDYFKREFVNPAILAIEEFNAKGGLLGQKIEFVVEDNRADAGTAQSAARKLVDVDHVSMISISISPAVLATLPITDPNHVMVMTVSQHPKILASEWAALSTPTAAAFGVAAAKYAFEHQKAMTAGLLLRSASPARPSKRRSNGLAEKSLKSITLIPKIKISGPNSLSCGLQAPLYYTCRRSERARMGYP